MTSLVLTKKYVMLKDTHVKSRNDENDLRNKINIQKEDLA